MSIPLSTQEIFIQKTLTFENNFMNNEIIPVPIKDAKFGILNLQAVSTPVSANVHDFVFTIDCSASMTDICSDNKTKMQHIIHTLKNMILYFKENPNIKNHVTVNAFDDKIYPILERCPITNENFNEVIQKIEEITPRGSTNIEMALKNVSELVSNIKEGCSTSIISNIFMTDGNATSGNCNYNALAQLVDRSITNAFIGFGIQHDSTLLNTISNGDNSAYYFIDQLENAGYVYGEILHGIMYKLLKNVTICVENGLVYDYKNNTWDSSLVIGEIVSEANKIFHVCSNDPDKCVVRLTAHMANDDSTSLEFSIHNEGRDVNDCNTFQKYIYRQRTLQHLYMVKDFLKRKSDANITKDSIFMNVNKDRMIELKKEEISISESLRTFIVEMKNFMLENNLYEDNFMKNLCDDIYICYRTFGTIYGDMYVSSRQRSQGAQRCYTVSHTPEDMDDTHLDEYDNNDECGGGVLTPGLLTRRHTRSTIGLSPHHRLSPPHRLSPHPLKHNTVKITDAPYLTPTSRKLMREISGKNDMDSDNDSMSVEL